MRLILIILASILAGVLALLAADHYVMPPGGSGTNNPPYTNWADAATNIQWAIDVAAAGETVWVADGTYVLTNQVSVSNRITLKSVNGYTSTLVCADWPVWTTRCFNVYGTSVVDGFTISNGHFITSNNYDGGGGARVSTNGIIQNCFFTYNYCSNDGNYAGGGGVWVSNGIISNCTFVVNVSTSYYLAYRGIGGGINASVSRILKCTLISNYSSFYGGGYCDFPPNASPVGTISNCFIAWNYAVSSGGGVASIYNAIIVDSIISNNYASSGGGVLNAFLTNCVIINNRSGSTGAGFSSANVAVNIRNCVFTGNSGPRGGAFTTSSSSGFLVDSCIISNNTGSPAFYLPTVVGTIRNCLIANNTNNSMSFTGGNGGAVYMTNVSGRSDCSNAVLVNCTIIRNYALTEGGGVYSATATATYTNNLVVNCVIASNSSGNAVYPNVYNTGDRSNFYFYTCANIPNAPLAPGQGNITNDPAFADAAAGNWRLKSTSPCVNAGSNQSWMATSSDLDGRIRLRYGTADMGAYETIYYGTILKF